MAGVFDIDLESEDVSDAEVRNGREDPSPNVYCTVDLNPNESFSQMNEVPLLVLQDEVCNFTVEETEPYVFLMIMS